MEETCRCEVCDKKFLWCWADKEVAKRLCSACWHEMRAWYLKHGGNFYQTKDGHVDAYLTYVKALRGDHNVRQEPSS